MLAFIQLNFTHIQFFIGFTILLWGSYFALKYNNLIPSEINLKKILLIANLLVGAGYCWYLMGSTVHNQVDKTSIDRSFIESSTNNFNNKIR